MQITPTLSVTLNLLRFLAALIVVIGHMNLLEFSNLGIEIGKYGHTMVVLFFVISGYIIGRTTIDQKPDAKAYSINRASRIYIVALPNIALCFTAALLIPSIEGTNAFATTSSQIVLLLKSLFFLNQSWVKFENPPLNPPFWSLCYEVWYYVIFAAFYYPKSNYSKALAGGTACILAGPAIMALMPAWLCGLALVYLKPDQIKNPWLTIAAALLVVMFIVEARLDTAIQKQLSTLIPAIWRLGSSTRFLTDYILAACFGAVILSAGKIKIIISTIVEKIIANLAGFSFTLYLFHDPILRLLQTLANLKQISYAMHVAVLASVLLSCWWISLATEARTSSLRRLLMRVLEK